MFNPFKKKVQKQHEILSPVDYNYVFDNNIIDDTPIEVLDIGELNVPTGQIIVCDPLVFSSLKPFTKTIKPGKYPIKLYIAKSDEYGDRYAIAKLEITTKKAVKWVLAIKDDDDISELTEEGDYIGFPVDSGTAGFMDYKSGLEYDKFYKDFVKNNTNGNIYYDFFSEEFKKNANNSSEEGNWINFQMPNTDLNITMFHSGYGDGSYPSYWGIDVNGEITSLIIDFFVLQFPEDKR